MKKITAISMLLILSISFLSSCKSANRYYDENVTKVNECEYIISHNLDGDILSHKGDCNNPIHKLVVHDTIYIL